MRQDGSHERTAPPVPRQVERADPNSGSPTPFSVTGHTVPLELYVSKEVLMPGGGLEGRLDAGGTFDFDAVRERALEGIAKGFKDTE